MQSSGNAHLIQTGLFIIVCCCSRADQQKRFPNNKIKQLSLREHNNHNWNQEALKYLYVHSDSTTFRITVGLIMGSIILPLVVWLVWGKGWVTLALQQSSGMSGGECGVGFGLPFSGRMTRDHAATPGMMETKLFSILPLHTGRKEKAQESWADIQLTLTFAGTIIKCKYYRQFLKKPNLSFTCLCSFIRHLFKDKFFSSSSLSPSHTPWC